MKITQLRGDLAAFRNLELSIVLNAMKTENSRKPPPCGRTFLI